MLPKINNPNFKAQPLPPPVRAARVSKMIEELNTLEAPGLRPIKQVELYSKWGPLLPEKDRLVTCPKPPDEIVQMVKKEKNTKAAISRKKKKDRNKSEQAQSKKQKV